MKKILVIFVCMLILASCAAGPNNTKDIANEKGETASFFQGLWHGIIIPVTLIVSFFTPDVNVYEVHNNGVLYNIGFFLGLTIILGGGGGSAGRLRRRREK
jgi:hypothetical protein